MAWETRPNSRRPYYYKKVRVGGKVRSVYLGRTEEAQQEAARRKRRLDMDWSLIEWDLFHAYASSDTEVHALILGFHKHRGVYRGRRGFKRTGPNQTDKITVRALFARLRFLRTVIYSLGDLDRSETSPCPLRSEQSQALASERGVRERVGLSGGLGEGKHEVLKSLCYNAENRSFEKLQNLKRALKAVSDNRRDIARMRTKQSIPKMEVITGIQSPCDTT